MPQSTLRRSSVHTLGPVTGVVILVSICPPKLIPECVHWGDPTSLFSRFLLFLQDFWLKFLKINLMENRWSICCHLFPTLPKSSLWYKLKTREIFNYPDGHLFKMLLWRLSSILQWSSSLPSWNKYWESSMQKVLRVPTRKNGRASQQL